MRRDYCGGMCVYMYAMYVCLYLSLQLHMYIYIIQHQIHAASVYICNHIHIYMYE